MGMVRLSVQTPVKEQKLRIQIKAEEMCNDWLTVNEVTKVDKVVSEKQQPQVTLNQPIGAKLANERKLRRGSKCNRTSANKQTITRTDNSNYSKESSKHCKVRRKWHRRIERRNYTRGGAITI